MIGTRMVAGAGLAALVALPFVLPNYFLHIVIQVLLFGLIYTAWGFMGRFGLVSLGHGAFMGVGAYTSSLLWNLYGVTPWLGIPAGMALAVLLALVIGYPCFHLRIVGHYFALVTLALGQVVALLIIAARDVTGGSLGMTPRAVGTSWLAEVVPFPSSPASSSPQPMTVPFFSSAKLCSVPAAMAETSDSPLTAIGTVLHA